MRNKFPMSGRIFLADPTLLLIFHALFMAGTLWVVARGVQRGLERASLIMMPLLFLVLLILVVYAAVSTGAYFGKASHFLFDPNFHLITGRVIINAMGHAFFTLAIGVGAMLIYGSYVPKQISIGWSVVITAGLDVLVALLSGLAIFPIIFEHHLAPTAGPGLMFMVLPIAFAKMPDGQWVGALFFLLLLFAAWTSSINIAEPLVAALWEKTNLKRGHCATIVAVAAWLLGLLSVFSFNVWAHDKIWGFTPFDLITDAVTNVILPIGGIFYALFAGWAMRKEYSKAELALKRDWIYWCWRFATRYIAPIGILVVFIGAFAK